MGFTTPEENIYHHPMDRFAQKPPWAFFEGEHGEKRQDVNISNKKAHTGHCKRNRWQDLSEIGLGGSWVPAEHLLWKTNLHRGPYLRLQPGKSSTANEGKGEA